MKFKIFILIISMFFCYILTSQSFAQTAKEKSIEKVEEGTSHNIITRMNTLLSSTAGKIVGSVLSILIVYLLLNILFKRVLIPRFSKSNFKRYIPILKILFWVIAIGLILIFILIRWAIEKMSLEDII